MLVPKALALRPLLDSREGLHLTAYLERRSDGTGLEQQLAEVIRTATAHLSPVLNKDDLAKFLEPIISLASNGQLLNRFPGSLGLFRTSKLFRLVHLPLTVEYSCVVATTFHVKPLLRWLQNDDEFLLISLDENSATLYHGTRKSFQYWQRQSLPSNPVRTCKEIEAWISSLTETVQPWVFIAGASETAHYVAENLHYKRTHRRLLEPAFTTQICSEVRKLLSAESDRQIERSLIEFHAADELNLTRKNIFQIAKAAVRGRVRKLIVADGAEIFGVLDFKTGGIAVHPADLDHEDDDLLDDLAQVVLASGGEVLVVPKEKIPKGRLLLAILDTQDVELTVEQRTVS